MTRHATSLLLLTPLLLIGCGRFLNHPSDAGLQPHYVIGPAYQAGAAWFYPREDFYLDATGLAVVLPDRTGFTADGETRDATAMAGAHATLQLPAVARVTNLETGLQALIRINDRGPASPGRLIGLTQRAGDRLGVMPGAATRVRVQVEDGLSLALRASLQGSPGVAVARAPRDRVASEELAPPPGLERSTRRRIVAVALPGTGLGTAIDQSGVIVPARLPDTAVRVPTDIGQLWLRAGDFGEVRYADQVRARLAVLGTTVERVRQGRSDTFRVRAGPFANVAQADSALDRALGAGVTDAHIVVE